MPPLQVSQSYLAVGKVERIEDCQPKPVPIAHDGPVEGGLVVRVLVNLGRGMSRRGMHTEMARRGADLSPRLLAEIARRERAERAP